MKKLFYSTFFILLTTISTNAQVNSKPFAGDVGHMFARGKLVTLFSWSADTLNVTSFSIDQSDNETKLSLPLKWANDFFLTIDSACWFTGQKNGQTSLFRYRDSVQQIATFQNSPSLSVLTKIGQKVYITERYQQEYKKLIELDMSTLQVKTLVDGGPFSNYSFARGNSQYFYKRDSDFRIYELKDASAFEIFKSDSLWNPGGMVKHEDTLLFSAYSPKTGFKNGLVKYDIGSGDLNWILKGYDFRLEELSLQRDTLYFGLAYSTNSSWQLYKMRLAETTQPSFEIVPLVSRGKKIDDYQKAHLTGSLYNTVSKDFGTEPTVIKNGVLNVIDINKRYVRSTPYDVAYENSNEYVFLATNGNDSFYYWYKVDKETLKTESLHPYKPIHSTSKYSFSKKIGALTNDYFVWFDRDEGNVLWFPLNGDKTVQPQRSSRDSVNWELDFFRPSSTWLNRHSHNLYLAGLACDLKDNVYINLWRQSPYAHETTHNYSDTVYTGVTTHNLTALDRFGRVKWNYNYGSTSSIISGENSPVIVDKESNIIIAGELWQKSLIDTDTFNLHRTALFVAKISPQGNTIWKKTFNFSYWADHITNLAVDSDNNIYLSFAYDDFAFQGITGTLTSQYDPTNGLMKLDKMGNEIWLKNIPMTRLNSVHNVSDVLMDRNSKYLYVLTTQSGYNYLSTCKYNKDYTTVLKYDLDGNLIWTREFQSDDMLYSSNIEETRYGELEINGFVRGNLETGEFSYSTKDGPNCQEMEPYSIWIDSETGSDIRLKTGSSLFPFGGASNSDFTIYTGAQQGSVAINSHFNNQEIWRIEKSGDPFDFGYNTKVCIGTNAIYVADIVAGGTSSNINLNNFAQSVFLKRIGIPDNYLTPPYFEDTEAKNVFLFPNPSSGFLRYELAPEANYTKYVLYDIKGSEIEKGEISGKTGTLQLGENIVNGLYIIRLTGVDSAEAQKLYIQR